MSSSGAVSDGIKAVRAQITGHEDKFRDLFQAEGCFICRKEDKSNLRCSGCRQQTCELCIAAVIPVTHHHRLWSGVPEDPLASWPQGRVLVGVPASPYTLLRLISNKTAELAFLRRCPSSSHSDAACFTEQPTTPLPRYVLRYNMQGTCLVLLSRLPSF